MLPGQFNSVARDMERQQKKVRISQCYFYCKIVLQMKGQQKMHALKNQLKRLAE